MNGQLHRRQVGRAEPRQAQSLELRHAGGRVSDHHTGQHGRDRISQHLKLCCGVGMDSGGDVDDVAQQADFDGTVHAGDTHGCVVGQEGLGRVVVNGIGRIQHLGVGIHQRLNLGHGVHLSAAHARRVEGAVDGRDVGRGHAQHAR